MSKRWCFSSEDASCLIKSAAAGAKCLRSRGTWRFFPPCIGERFLLQPCLSFALKARVTSDTGDKHISERRHLYWTACVFFGAQLATDARKHASGSRLLVRLQAEGRGNSGPPRLDLCSTICRALRRRGCRLAGCCRIDGRLAFLSSQARFHIKMKGSRGAACPPLRARCFIDGCILCQASVMSALVPPADGERVSGTARLVSLPHSQDFSCVKR